MIDVDYRALVHACRLVVPGMVARGRGQVVNIASIAAVEPVRGMAVYSGTKAAVLAFSESLRRELRGTGVAVSAVLPSFAATVMTRDFRPLMPVITAERVAHAVVRVPAAHSAAVGVPRGVGAALRLYAVLPRALRARLDRVAGAWQP